MRTGAHKAHEEAVEAEPREARTLEQYKRKSARTSDDSYADIAPRIRTGAHKEHGEPPEAAQLTIL